MIIVRPHLNLLHSHRDESIPLDVNHSVNALQLACNLEKAMLIDRHSVLLEDPANDLPGVGCVTGDRRCGVQAFKESCKF